MPAETELEPLPPDWQNAVAPFRRPSTARGSWQLFSTVAVIVTLVALAYVLLQVHWSLTIPVTVVLSGCLTRIFILHHDCGHGSFFKTRRANDLAGTVIGWFVLTPYRAWRRQHAIHHAGAGNLARRGTGDIWTLTTREYEAAGAWRRLGYRLVRNPFIMCVGGGTVVFLALYRVPSSRIWGYKLESSDVRDVIVTNLMTVLIWLGLFWLNPILLFGIYVPATLLAAAVGVWLFYVQHQFEEVYWEEPHGWTFERGAVAGSSYLRLPGVLRWTTASIGVHHIHHLAPTIPNYRLADCVDAVPRLSAGATQLNLWGALKTLRLKLYDQDQGELITFAEHGRRRASASSRS